MDIDSIIPTLCGTIGGMIATWLVARWSRNVPAGYGGTSRQRLGRKHRPAIWTASVMLFIGLFAGVALYPLGGFASTDARPLLWAFGLASVLPLFTIALVSLLSGHRLKEAYVAYALGQGSPLWVMYVPLGAGLVAFGFAVAGLADR